MLRFSLTGGACLSALLALTLIAVPGCGKKKDTQTADDFPDYARAGKGDAPKPRDPVKIAERGTLRGVVRFKGTLPTPGAPKGLNEHADCKVGGTEHERIEQAWLLGKDNGVENCVISLAPPPGKYFALSEADLKRIEPAIMDQPHCAFIPHVQVCFPEYYDGKTMQRTGQKFIIRNSAAFTHNFKYSGAKSGEANLLISPATERLLELRVEKASPVAASCSIHTWMSARIWTFEHPFYARTDKDGNFEIKDVPAGMPVTVKAWHEVGVFAGGYGGQGQSMTFAPGKETKLDLEISAP